MGKLSPALYFSGYICRHKQLKYTDPSMRKIIGLMILLVQFSCTQPLKVSDTVTFKIQYQPEQKYNNTSERTSHTIIKYSGSEKALQKLKSMGIQNPTISDKKSQTEWILKTGKLEDETNFPATVEYMSTSINDGETGIPIKANFSGKFLGDHLPVFNSVVSDGLDEKDKTTLLQSLQNNFTQFSFPEKKIKIGEQFSIENPSTIQMVGLKVDIGVTTTYQLISISKNIANFDVVQQYTLNPKYMDNSFKGTVSGKGHLVYDIDHTIVLNYTMNTEMEITKKLDSFDFDLKSSSGIIQTTSLSKQKTKCCGQ